MSLQRCPDQGICHHECGERPCFRVLLAGPLSGVYPGDQWPDKVIIEQMRKRLAEYRAEVARLRAEIDRRDSRTVHFCMARDVQLTMEFCRDAEQGTVIRCTDTGAEYAMTEDGWGPA